jgi:4a-hydroxytetrahydrobiopterin dehydratase
MEVTYKTCCVRFTTHSIDGLSANDFLCAHRIEALLRPE